MLQQPSSLMSARKNTPRRPDGPGRVKQQEGNALHDAGGEEEEEHARRMRRDVFEAGWPSGKKTAKAEQPTPLAGRRHPTPGGEASAVSRRG